MSNQLLPNDWNAFFKSHQSNDDFNKVHDKITKIAAAGGAEEDNDKAVAEVMKTVIENQPSVTIAFKAPIGDVQLLHNIFKVGGTLSMPKARYYGLIGGDHKATTVEFDPKDMFTMMEKVSVPILKEIYQVESKQGILNLTIPKSPTPEFIGCHAIMIPPFIAEAFRGVASGEGAESLIKLLAEAEAFDKEKDGDTPKASKSVDSIVQWLYCLINGKVLLAAYQVTTNPIILSKSDSIHSKCIAQTNPPHQPSVGLSNEEVRRTCLATERLVDLTEQQRLSSNVTPKKKRWNDRYASLMQTMLLTASQKDDNDIRVRRRVSYSRTTYRQSIHY